MSPSIIIGSLAAKAQRAKVALSAHDRVRARMSTGREAHKIRAFRHNAFADLNALDDLHEIARSRSERHGAPLERLSPSRCTNTIGRPASSTMATRGRRAECVLSISK